MRAFMLITSYSAEARAAAGGTDNSTAYESVLLTLRSIRRRSMIGRLAHGRQEVSAADMYAALPTLLGALCGDEARAGAAPEPLPSALLHDGIPSLGAEAHDTTMALRTAYTLARTRGRTAANRFVLDAKPCLICTAQPKCCTAQGAAQNARPFKSTLSQGYVCQACLYAASSPPPPFI